MDTNTEMLKQGILLRKLMIQSHIDGYKNRIHTDEVSSVLNTLQNEIIDLRLELGYEYPMKNKA